MSEGSEERVRPSIKVIISLAAGQPTTREVGLNNFRRQSNRDGGFPNEAAVSPAPAVLTPVFPRAGKLTTNPA